MEAFVCDRRRLTDRRRVATAVEMARNPGDVPGSSQGGSHQGNGWKRALLGRPEWVSPEPSPEEIVKLRRWFPEVARLPEEAVRADEERWRLCAVVAKTLSGRRVAVEAVEREFKARAGLKGEVRGFGLEQGHLMVRFSEPGERDLVLGRPWVVAGQALAVEAWRPRFCPGEGAISSALVWVRLPRLPVELWGEEALRGVLDLAGEVVATDACTTELRRIGFARVCVKVDLSRPLRSGVLIDGPDGTQWQRFVWESVDGVCLRCGRFHHAAACTEDGGREDAGQTGDGEEVLTEEGPRLGPWLVAVRRWVQGSETGVAAGKKGAGSERAPVSNPRPNQPGKGPTRADSGHDSAEARDGWLKPSRFARRSSPRINGRTGGGGHG